MKAEYINPILASCTEVIQQVCNMAVEKGKLCLRNGSYPEKNVIINIGLIGDFKGDVSFSFDEETACRIASTMMCGMPVPQLDDLAKSAISELGNMIMGTAASMYYKMGAVIDITPPKIFTGNQMSAFVSKAQCISIPMVFPSGGALEINITVQK